MIGAIPEIPAGTHFDSRQALYDAGVHQTLRAGIVGREKRGAESIVLSGGYADDEDHGDVIVYTGHGGRDPATGRQIADQKFTRQNMALAKSALEGLPVRVVRGSEHISPHSPESGYRYDGLYWVEEYWSGIGRDGYLVWRFRLVSEAARVEGEPASAADDKPARRATTILRIQGYPRLKAGESTS